MRTLLLSAVLYLIGVAAVLLVRPSFMFHEDGRWKEFGTASKEHTLFPFWFFCITWALLSYVVTLFVVGEYKRSNSAPLSITGPIATTAAAAASALRETEPPDDLVPVLPTVTRSTNIQTPYGTMKPGYYMLDQRASRKTGIPKYIYVGEGPPDDEADA